MKHAQAAIETVPHAVEHADIAEPSLLQNPETWIVVAFAIFAILSLRYLLPMLVKALDVRADKIRDQLEQASKLRAQAEALLASYEAERAAKQTEAQHIVDEARKEAAALQLQAEAELNQLIERKTAQVTDKIVRAEHEALNELRSQIVQTASEAVRRVLTEHLNQAGEDPAIARSLAALQRQVH